MSNRFNINLVKGESIALPQGLKKIIIGCGWDPNTSRSNSVLDFVVIKGVK